HVEHPRSYERRYEPDAKVGSGTRGTASASSAGWPPLDRGPRGILGSGASLGLTTTSGRVSEGPPASSSGYSMRVSRASVSTKLGTQACAEARRGKVKQSDPRIVVAILIV